MSTPDYLKSLPEIQVAGWYRRLAIMTSRARISGEEPMASRFLMHWLDNRDSNSVFKFTPPEHLKTSSYVLPVMQFHRAVFLTEKKAHYVKSGKTLEEWKGVIPRLQGNLWDMSQPLEMQYESLVEVGGSLFDLARIQKAGSPGEKDMLGALRGFQLGSRVKIKGVRLSANQVRIEFLSWVSWARDRYDFDYSERFTVNNPDYGSKEKNAVRPMDEELTVFHANAKRLEDKGLAAPYNLVSDEWPGGANLKAQTVINPQKSL